jgi:uncharacterized membrane protein YccC
MQRLSLSYEHLLGMRFAVNVAIASTIVWAVLMLISDSNPIWALASMVAGSDPEPDQARRIVRARLTNVLVGCATGFFFVLLGGSQNWILPAALAVAVLLSVYVVRVKTMWRQAPITAAVVIAGSVVQGSRAVGIERGLHKVAEVAFGCCVGILVSWLMSKVWLVRRPQEEAESDSEKGAVG